MSRGLKPIIQPTSCITLPVGKSTATTLTIRQIAAAMGLCNDNGALQGNVDSYRLVGLEARAIPNGAEQSFVKISGGATYQLSNSDRYAKLKVSDKNQLGFWRNGTVPSLEAFELANVDVGSITIAVRYKNVNFL